MIASAAIKRRIAVFLLLLFGTLAVVSTYTRLSWTDDEQFHIACGMEWWKEGVYHIQPLHPPLARVMDAALWYVTDVLYGEKALEGFTPRQTYIYKMILARLGALPFYLLSCIIVYHWSRRLYGDVPAILSLALYVWLSTVTAHGSLATTDMAYTAVFMWALFCGIAWLHNPDAKRSLLLGAALGIMVGTKFSGLVQWPAAMALILIAQSAHNYRMAQPVIPIRSTHLFHTFVYSLPVMIAALALIYRFDITPLIDGIKAAHSLDQVSFGVWFYGPFKHGGAWDFFPVVFYYKTPLSFLLASAIGLILITRAFLHRQFSISHLYPFLTATGVMLVSMTSQINLGVRHVLPVYPLLAVPSGYALWWLWKGGVHKRLLCGVLLCAQLTSFILAAPQHLSYFNILAGDGPEYITLDSDFDWGQDMIALDEALKERAIKSVYMCARKDTYANAAIVVHAAILPCPKDKKSGWFAVGRAQLMLNNNIAWLKSYEALQIENSTMNLYHIP